MRNGRWLYLDNHLPPVRLAGFQPALGGACCGKLWQPVGAHGVAASLERAREPALAGNPPAEQGRKYEQMFIQ